MARSQEYSLIHEAYETIKTTCRDDWGSVDAAHAILKLVLRSLSFLSRCCQSVPLRSRVPNKRYYAFNNNQTDSRPVNQDLFENDTELVRDVWNKWLDGGIDTIDSNDLSRVSYTMALAPCLAMELFNRRNVKGPATYFEHLIGHVFARELEVNPQKQITLDADGQDITPTMDFLFNGRTKKVHLPVKMSTRERGVQAWAHQKLLDEAFVEGKYEGIMVLFAETKLSSETHEVIEITTVRL